MKFKTLMFALILIMLAVGVSAFSHTETFTTELNSSIWNNKSVQNTTYMNVSDGALNFFGNRSASITNGVYLSAVESVGVDKSGTLQYYFTIENEFSTNQLFHAGLITTGAGVGVTIQGGDSIYVKNYQTNLRSCPTDLKPLNTDTHLVRITAERDGTDTTYNVYYDGVFWCSVTQSDLITPLYANFTFASTSNTYHKVRVDNVFYTDGATNTTTKNVGEWCQKNSDCVTGSCQYNYCAYKNGGESCSDSFQCLSGYCDGGHCSKVDTWTYITASKNQIFGDSIAVNNFVALFLIFGLSIAVILGGGLSVVTGAVALSIVLFGSIFFTIVGWLSPFILIGLILVCLVLVVFLMVANAGS